MWWLSNIQKIIEGIIAISSLKKRTANQEPRVIGLDP
jgi:hypothetical protein